MSLLDFNSDQRWSWGAPQALEQGIVNMMLAAGVASMAVNPLNGIARLVDSTGNPIVIDDLSETLAEENARVTLTTQTPLKRGAGRLTQVRCESGAGITVNVYDNATASSGRVVYTGTLSAGGFVLPSNAWAVNGLFTTISGGVVEFTFSEA